jgi:hypothetical protein
MVAACERLRSRCEDGVLPFLATVIAAMGEGEAPVSHVEAEASATQRDCLFVKFSPATGRGICDAVGSLVELAHGARDQYAIDQEGYTHEVQEGGGISGIISLLGMPSSRLTSSWMDVIPPPRRSANTANIFSGTLLHLHLVAEPFVVFAAIPGRGLVWRSGNAYYRIAMQGTDSNG